MQKKYVDPILKTSGFEDAQPLKDKIQCFVVKHEKNIVIFVVAILVITISCIVVRILRSRKSDE